MKKIICSIITVLLCFGSFAQRYEVWVRTPENNRIKGNYAFSNDSVLMLYSNPSLLFPSKDKYFSWDDVNSLKIRNKSINQLGQLVGIGAGILAWTLIDKSIKDTEGGWGLGGIYATITVPVFLGTGTLIGHLATNKKKKIPINGLNSQTKNELLKSKLKRKTRENQNNKQNVKQ
ncbi:MAG: hypothetical protein HOG79_02240 [Prolixibacteraceae bacterium]|nr:hypothetical protein [Prolixibacteraceae bacterium]